MPYQYGGLTEQRKASIHRRLDADALRTSKRWNGAMYMLGYSVECSLKAKLMERFESRNLRALQEALSKRLKKKVDLLTHSLDDLLEYTHAEHRLGALRVDFGVCRKWRVAWRYSPDNGSERTCRGFFEACDRVLEFVAKSI